MTHADCFLSMLGSDTYTFQTFDERSKGSPKMRGTFHGRHDEFKERFRKWNSWGAGIFATINETDLKGRKRENVTRVRSLFADLDGSPLGPIYQSKLKPHMIVESSPGKYHAYWLISDCPLEKFSVYQKAIADKFMSDPSVNDLPRVMRLPGYNHNKATSVPVKIVNLNRADQYTLERVKAGLGLILPSKEKKIRSSPQRHADKSLSSTYQATGLMKGNRNNALFKVASAMRGRGESFDDTLAEILILADECHPPFPHEETEEIARNVWSRYG